MPYTNASPTRPAFMPLSHRYSCQLILAWISLALRAPSILVKTNWAKTRGLLEFHFQSNTPQHSAARTAVNRRPTFHEGMEYQLADGADIRLQQLCHVASFETLPARCFP